MSGSQTTTLFRPVGLAELGLIYDSGIKNFPPRLPEQPIFYPVLNQEYASQITREWNAPSAPDFAGYVTKFALPTDYLVQFPVKKVGGNIHEELWVPAEHLTEFNAQILSGIVVVEAYFGKNYVGFVPDKFGLAGKNAIDQLHCLVATFGYSGMDFICETAANAKAVFLNFPFWSANESISAAAPDPQKQKMLDGLTTLWNERQPLNPLCQGKLI